MVIRKAQHADIDRVHQIKVEQFPNPWKKELFHDELTHDMAHFYVAEEKNKILLGTGNTGEQLDKKSGENVGEIVGYILFWIIEETLELHDIAVSGRNQGKGIASTLMDFLLKSARKKKVEEIFLEVRRSNQKAITLYEKFDFKKIGERKNYYNNPPEDALIYGFYPNDREGLKSYLNNS